MSRQQFSRVEHLLQKNNAINSGMPGIISINRGNSLERELIGTYYNPMTNSEVHYVRYEIPTEASHSLKDYMRNLNEANECDDSEESRIQHSLSCEDIARTIALFVSNIQHANSTIRRKTRKLEELLR